MIARTVDPPFKLATLLLGLLLMAGALGRAQAQSEAEPAAYRALVEEAVAEHQAGNYAEARALFSRAVTTYSSARAWRGLGMAEYELRNYSDSAIALERALTSRIQPLEGELRAQTQELLERARRFVARLNLEVQPPAASVIIDGVPVQLGPQGSLVLEVGDHTLEFRAEGYSPERRVLKVVGGEERTLHVALPMDATPSAGRASALAAAPLPAPDRGELAGAADVPRRQRFYVAPRFTLLLPSGGSQHYDFACNFEDCPSGQSPEYKRKTGGLFGIELMLAARERFFLGLGVHVQLNQSEYEFSNGVSAELGRLFWLPAIGEYRFVVNDALSVPVRGLLGLAVVKAGQALGRVGDSQREGCREVSESDIGGDCSVNGPPAIGLIAGVSPGLVLELAQVGLRVDLTLGYQWLRLVNVDARWNDGDRLEHRQTDGSFVAALSAGIEL